MLLKILETLLIYVLVYVLAFDDIYVDATSSLEMIEKGRTQYQLLREKGNLPRYGPCWKGALDHVEDGCKHLSEETQSDMALHLTNCFLEMSGHDTYNCELDKKRNLRGICISSMTDRAFNVYTELYTHVQNICWFLRGQIWYETISEGSMKVGRQLEASAKNQEVLLETQRQSIDVQNKILRQEQLLEEVLGDLYVSTKAHKEILGVLTKSVASFQTWVIGEISWVDSMIYYTVTCLFIFILTSVKRTSRARLPLFIFLGMNLVLERVLCGFLISEDSVVNANLLYDDIYCYVWYCRKFFIICIFCLIVYYSYQFRDLAVENNTILIKISAQNAKLFEMIQSINNNYLKYTPKNDKFNLINESLYCSNGFVKKDLDESSNSNYSDKSIIKSRRTFRNYVHLSDSRYNLRSSKANTPEIN